MSLMMVLKIFTVNYNAFYDNHLLRVVLSFAVPFRERLYGGELHVVHTK